MYWSLFSNPIVISASITPDGEVGVLGIGEKYQLISELLYIYIYSLVRYIYRLKQFISTAVYDIGGEYMAIYYG